MSDLESFEIGSLCSIKIDNEVYPAIYIEYNNLGHMVYLKHLDRVEKVKNVYEYEPCEMNEQGKQIEFCYMESPAYFRKGTTLGIKWGNSGYGINDGGKIDIDQNEKVDKITCTLKM